MGKVGKYSVSAFEPSSTAKSSDPELLVLLRESWDAREEGSKRGAGFAIPIAELDEDGDYDRAARKVRQAATELGVGAFVRQVVDDEGVDCVGFAAQERRAYKKRGQ